MAYGLGQRVIPDEEAESAPPSLPSLPISCCSPSRCACATKARKKRTNPIQPRTQDLNEGRGTKGRVCYVLLAVRIVLFFLESNEPAPEPEPELEPGPRLDWGTGAIQVVKSVPGCKVFWLRTVLWVEPSLSRVR